METRYPNLLKPFKIKRWTFKNRMLGGPLGSCVNNTGGYLHQENIDYYEALARGGAARVMTGDHPVNCTDAGYGGGAGRLAFYGERPPRELGDSMENFVRSLHRHDVIAFTEFEHEGLSAFVPAGQSPIGPVSYVREDGVKVVGMTEGMIDRVCEEFAVCAKRAKDMGLDGVMIHGGHGKIIDQFRSRLFNTRDDQYGGSVENRCRFGIKLLERVRERVGDDFLIELRFSADEGGFDGGITTEETIEFLKLIDGKGLVDLLHCSAGVHFWPEYNMRLSSPAYYPNFYNLPAAKKIKAAGIKTPLILINGVNDPDTAEQVIADGYADFVCMARQIDIADPNFPRKVMEGRTEYINRCIRCYSCYDGAVCAVNPLPLYEFRNEPYVRPKAPVKRRVVIVGGGITGLKAAETAAELGHEVIILEKDSALGGVLKFADTDAYKFDIKHYKNNMIKRVESAENVDVRLNTTATPELVASMDPYAVIVAIGAAQKIPPIPGVDGSNVIEAMDVYYKPESVGDSVAIIGGGLAACEVAMHLGKTGKKVTIIGRRDKLAPYEKVMVSFFDPIPGILEEYSKFDRPVEVVTGCDCTEIFSGGVKGTKNNGSEVVVYADTVVLASGMSPKHDEAYGYNGIAPYVRIAGDCREAGRIKQAVAAGYNAAKDIQ